MRIINKIGDIDDKHIKQALKINNKEKLLGEKMMEKRKNNIWKYITIPVTCVAIVASGMVYMNSLKNNEEKIVKSKDKYLTANYSMLLYKEVNDYINDNINLEEIKDDSGVTITSDKVFNKVPEEYKYCSGEVIIKKNKYGIYEHIIKSSCDNEANNNVNLTMRVYTNMNQTSAYEKQIIGNIINTKDGYNGSLMNYIVNKTENSISEKYDGVTGTISLNKDLDIKNINILDKAKTGIGTVLYTLDNNYIITEYPNGNNGNQVINYYDNKLKLLWNTELDNNHLIFNYLYETKDKIAFNNFDKIIIFNKKDGNIYKEISLKDIGNTSLTYSNGYLYAFDNSNYRINKINLDGKIVSYVELLNQEGINKNISFTDSILSENISIFNNDDNIYVFDKKGKLINKISTSVDGGTNEYRFESFNISNNYYEIVYNTNTEVHSVNEDGKDELIQANQKKYIRYDLNNNILISADIDETYGYNTLNSMGLVLNDVFKDSNLLGDKLFEYIYSPNNNGTFMFMLYDYSKVNDLLVDEDTNTSSEEISVDLSNYKGYWYINKEEYEEWNNPNCLNIKSINKDELSINLYVARTAGFDFNIKINNNTGEFNANSEFGSISGSIVLIDDKIRMNISNSSVNGIKNNEKYEFTFHTDKESSVYKKEFFDSLLLTFLPRNSANNFMKTISKFGNEEITEYILWHYINAYSRKEIQTDQEKNNEEYTGYMTYTLDKSEIDKLVYKVFGKKSSEYNIAEPKGRTGIKKIDDNKYQIYWFATGWYGPTSEITNVRNLNNEVTVEYKLTGNEVYGEEGKYVGTLTFYLSKNGNDWNVTKIEFNEK